MAERQNAVNKKVLWPRMVIPDIISLATHLVISKKYIDKSFLKRAFHQQL
jgi:hypothetical protein